MLVTNCDDSSGTRIEADAKAIATMLPIEPLIKSARPIAHTDLPLLQEPVASGRSVICWPSACMFWPILRMTDEPNPMPMPRIVPKPPSSMLHSIPPEPSPLPLERWMCSTMADGMAD